MSRRLPPRRLGMVAVALGAGVALVAAVLQFLAPSLSYQIGDRLRETASGGRGRPYRIALGVTTGTYYQTAGLLNRYLKERAGYELERVATAGVPENVRALLDRDRQIDFAMVESSSEEAARQPGVMGLAAFGEQYFFVVVPRDSPARDVRDLEGPFNPGLRAAGDAPTLGEKVLDYYGLLAPDDTRGGPAVTVVRPRDASSVVQDFEAGRMRAASRTQFLHSDLIDGILASGRYRLLPIADNEALSRTLPGTIAGTIPAGAYGPRRSIPDAPVPTLLVSALLVARADVPGHVVRDVLEALYDPRFSRDIQFPLSEPFGRRAGGLPLHPGAQMFYQRDDLVTSDRIGRLSFVLTLAGAAYALSQFVGRLRRQDRRRGRRDLLDREIATLQAIRLGIEEHPAANELAALLIRADDLLWRAEQDAVNGVLDTNGIATLRSLHAICWRAASRRSS